MPDIRESLAGLTTIVAADFDSRAKMTITPFGEPEAKQANIQDVVGNSILDGFIKGAITGFETTSSYLPIPMFTSGTASDFYTTAAGNITKAADDTGLTVNIPVRYSVLATGSFEGASNANFFFDILVNGTPITLSQEMERSGQGVGKPAAFPISGYTGVLSPGDTIQFGAKNSGDTITTISASLNIRFAGLT